LSGAWVVRGQRLIGMILAVYEDEPYAHVLPIRSVFNDIEAFLSKDNLISKVSLPSRLTYEGLPIKPKIYEPLENTNLRDWMVTRGSREGLDAQPVSDAPSLTANMAQRIYAKPYYWIHGDSQRSYIKTSVTKRISSTTVVAENKSVASQL
jgi:hypothetical protein